MIQRRRTIKTLEKSDFFCHYAIFNQSNNIDGIVFYPLITCAIEQCFKAKMG